MIRSILSHSILICLLIGGASRVSRAQITVDEAERRLKAKQASRPSAATQPTSELDRLREENRRLRERVASLQVEADTLRDILKRAAAAPAPSAAATRPAAAAAAAVGDQALNKEIVGRWRGGDITAGSGYLLEFSADSTYHQSFITNGEKSTGQYRVLEGGTLEMWSDKWPEDKKHNQYRLTVTPIQATLMPLVLDGVELKISRPLVLRRAE